MLTTKEIQNARLELQSLSSFAERHLANPSTPVAQKVHEVIKSMNKLIQESEEKAKSTMILDFKGPSSLEHHIIPATANVSPLLAPLVNSSDLILPLQSPAECLALLCHSILLSFDGMVCIAEKNSGGVSGFAAPLAPLPADTFVPPLWNAKKDNITFLYKHKAAPGKKVALEVSSTLDTTLVKIGFKSNASKPLELTLEHSALIDLPALSHCTTQPSELPGLFLEVDSLITNVSSKVLQALPFLRLEMEKVAQRENEAEAEAQQSVPMEVTRDLPPSRLQQSHIHRSRVSAISSPASVGTLASAPTSANSPLVGYSDVHPPLPTILPPPQPGFGPEGQLPMLYSQDRNNFNPNVGGPGGMLVGPDHAIFQGGSPGGLGRGAPGFGPGMPQPRYDPLISPNIYTDPLVNIGVDDVGEQAGRAKGRGKKAPRVPGEPAPDHLKPPDFEDPFF